MNERAIHAWVSGRVQGVNFRHATLHHATKWGITGWVRNLPDGRVELVACGTTEAIDKLTHWLHRGPPLAKVSNVDVEDIPWELFEDFNISK
ncbi:MAG: acylphosphatase [Gammaproteobacteria bacterium]